MQHLSNDLLPGGLIKLAGCPSSLEGNCSGPHWTQEFHPKTCPVLADKLKHVLKTALEKYVLPVQDDSANVL